MKNIVILGAGTGGTMMANKLRRELDRGEWNITVIDRNNQHVYQPGLLFVPFQMLKPSEIVKSRTEFLPTGVDFVIDEIARIDTAANTVHTVGKKKFPYDVLVIATGCRLAPEEIPGMVEGMQNNVHDFYTIEGAKRLSKAMDHFEGGKIVMHISEMPFKCPVAPIEFVFLADWYFQERGIRDKVEIEFVTPLGGMFTKPVATRVFSSAAEEKGINITTDFAITDVLTESNEIESADGKRVKYDLLVTIPPNMGSQFLFDSGVTDELCWMNTDKHKLKAVNHDNIYVLGDATNVPTSKAGSVTHFESEILCENILAEIEGKSANADFDGHSNCFIESGFKKAYLIDFNYEQEPLIGKFPLPAVGPFDLLGDTEINHMGKLMFKWTYWNVLLKGTEIPVVGPGMSMLGKKAI
ncbi:MAG: NAD(P)/FAD-dependent oxidoreductase [Desulfobulbaceae bacterium]|nr:NAD(P)/FAD-dependent oxidoreductase [Desulfobulbaceae bacterium]